MDGIKDLKNVIVVGATNLPQTLDPALLRPGRFDRIIYIPPPSKEVRKEIFRIHLGKFAETHDLSYLAEKTEGYSSADIKAFCEEMKLKLFQKSMKTGKKENKLSIKEIEEMLSQRKPSITKDLLRVYEAFIKEYGERK